MLPSSGFRGIIRADDDALAVYSEAAGVARIRPLAVALPVDRDDTANLVTWANASEIALIPRGSGSSMAGGAVGHGVIVDLSSLKAPPIVSSGRQTILCEAGVTRATVERAAEPHGLRFPVDPSSGAFCTIGGMVGTNAAGARSLAFGATREWVTSLRCVFADGSTAELHRGRGLPPGNPTLDRIASESHAWRERARAIPRRRVRKNSSGYAIHEFAESGDVIDLLIGSEGTLATITDVELALIELPIGCMTLLAAFSSLDDAVRGTAVAREGDAVACELLDRTFLEIAARGGRLPVPPESEAILLIELEGAPHSLDGAERDAEVSALLSARTDALERALRAVGATSVLVGVEPESAEVLWALRHAASPVLSRLDPGLANMQLVEDGAVPPERLADYVRGVRAALQSAGIRGVIFGHAGDAHVHVNALVDISRDDWRERTHTLFDDVVHLTAALGGTLAGEHGDGRLRTPVLGATWPPAALSLFRDIKNAFDPKGILNPGVKVPAANLSPPDNKFDPTLPAHPAAARRVLDRVLRERAWDRSRLELLDESR